MHPKKSSGYALLAGVLTITAVLLGLGIGLNSKIRTSDTDRLIIQTRIQAEAIAWSCMQEGLLRYTRDTHFRNADLNIAPGLCTITVTTQAGGATIETLAKIGNVSRTFLLDCRQQGSHCTPIQFREP